MSLLPVAWRRAALTALGVASLTGLSLDPARAQETTEEMQRAKAALSAALRNREAGAEKHVEAPAPTPAPAPAAAPPATASAAPVPAAAPVAAEPARPSRTVVAHAEPAPAMPPRGRPAIRERRAHKAASRIAVRKAASHRTYAARHRSRVQVAQADEAAAERPAAPRNDFLAPTGTAAPDYPATTGSLPVEAAQTAAAPRATAIVLPPSLAPTPGGLGSTEASVYREGIGWIRGTQEALAAVQQPLAGARGARTGVVAACREAIVPAAVAGGASEVYAAGTARPHRGRDGTLAPLEVRILYKGLGATEVRRASVTCELDRTGHVVAVTDAAPQPTGR